MPAVAGTNVAMELVGRPRLLPGEGFAVPDGLGRLALRATSESARRPLSWRGVRTTTVGGLSARIAGDFTAASSGVVLLHGVIVSSRYLVPLAAALADEFAVLVPDLPGYGMSANSSPDVSVAQLADAVVACAAAGGLARFALVANSFGAQIAVEAAIRFPAQIDRLVLIGPVTDPAARSLLQQYVRWQRNAPDEHLTVLPVMARDLLDLGPRRAARLLRLMLRHPIEERLPLVLAPTLVVRGGRDRVVPQRWARDATALLPDGRLAVLPGYGHMPHWSGALPLAALVREFLGR